MYLIHGNSVHETHTHVNLSTKIKRIIFIFFLSKDYALQAFTVLGIQKLLLIFKASTFTIYSTLKMV